jgi:hypothetical protein
MMMHATLLLHPGPEELQGGVQGEPRLLLRAP